MTKVLGWLVEECEREELLKRFPPVYPDVVAHHVTLERAADAAPLPPQKPAEIVGEADDGQGVQAMVVRLGGTTDRPDGSTYHITWSLDRTKGRKAVESNDVIAKLGWRPLDPVPVTLKPARF